MAMFQLDRLIYATTRPDKADFILRKERGLQLTASGRSFPGVATHIYPFPGGGFLEVTYIEDESQIASSEGGEAFHTFLKENGDDYYALILETDDLARVKQILEEEGYPAMVTPVQQVTDPAGEVITFQMLGSAAHLPWFVQYNKPRQTPAAFPQAAIIYTTTLNADVSLLEKVLGTRAATMQFPRTTAAVMPLGNASLRVESADKCGFAYLDRAGILFEKNHSKRGETE
jgi:hypothetical protein